MKIILASQSPRRKEILKDLGYSFLVVPSLYDEHIELANGIDQGVETLALEKAKSVQKNNKMITLAAERGIADRFHFPGFQKDAV